MHLKYHELFLSSLINDEEIRELVLDAERHFADGHWKEVVHKVSIAFATGKSKTQNQLGLYSPKHTLHACIHT